MTPREIIDAIKTSPIKERQAEINITYAILEPLIQLQQKCIDQMI